MQKSTGKFHYGYVIVACCFLIMFIGVGLVMSSAGIFYKPVSEDLGITVGSFGWYMSLNFLFSTLTLSFAGKLMEKYSARLILSVSSAVLGLTLLAMSRFTAVWEFYVAGAVIGICLAFLLYLGFATMLNRWFKTKMGLFVGICSAGSGLGGIIFNPVGGYLIQNYGWRTAYLVFGLMILAIVTPVLGIFMRSYPKDKGLEPYGVSEGASKTSSAEASAKTARSEASESGIVYSRAIRMPVFYALIVFAFLMNAAATLNSFLPAYAGNIGFSIEQASLVASAAMVGVTVGKIILGMINDRNTTVGVLVTTGLGIVGLCLLLAGRLGIALPIVGGFLFGWAYAGVTVQTPMLVRSVFGNRNYAQIYGNVAMALSVGGAVMAGGWGVLSDVAGFRSILLVGIVFLAISAGIGLFALRKKWSA